MSTVYLGQDHSEIIFALDVLSKHVYPVRRNAQLPHSDVILAITADQVMKVDETEVYNFLKSATSDEKTRWCGMSQGIWKIISWFLNADQLDFTSINLENDYIYHASIEPDLIEWYVGDLGDNSAGKDTIWAMIANPAGDMSQPPEEVWISKDAHLLVSIAKQEGKVVWFKAVSPTIMKLLERRWTKTSEKVTA